MKHISKSLFILLICAMIFASVGQVLADNPVPPTQEPSIESQVDELLSSYNQALSQELENGETTYIDTALGKQKVLTGISEEKLKNLWNYTRQKIDILTGRSEEDKAETAKNLQSLINEKVAYLYHSRMPYYDSSALVEYYKGGINAYTIDISTGQVIEVIPLSIEENHQSILSEEELEQKAKDYISNIDNLADIAALTLSIGRKGNNLFFRWEDLSKKLSGGMNPFIQIGYSSTGAFLNLVNTLPFAKNAAVTRSSTAIPYIDQFNEIYANGGSYWSATGPSMNTQNNAGYCYIAGWCSPKNFYYKSGVSSYPSSGMWLPNSNSDVQASAFIPSTHATGYATYYVYITGYDPDSWDIDQSDYFNTWVTITQEGTLANINEIKMMNYGDSGYEFAWDETWVYNP